MTKCRSFILAAACLVALAGAPPASAQLAKDKTLLIEKLRTEGMGELLEHLASSDELHDPILQKTLLINQLLLDYSTKRAAAEKDPDPTLAAELRAQAVAAFEKALDQRRGMVTSLYNDDQRPLWQADLAEQQIFEYLDVIEDNANDFYEFGVPSAQQRTAFETTIPLAMEEMADADLRLFHEMGDLPKQPDHEKKRVNTGLWDRMKNQYFALRVPYFLGHAAYYAALLPDSNPYYQKLDVNNLHIPHQKATAAEERPRLLALAIAKLDPFTKDLTDPYEVKRPSTCMIARAWIALGKFDQAIDILMPLVKDGNTDHTNLLARLALAEALEGKAGGQAPLDVLAEAQQQPLAKSKLLIRLLVVDATHRLLLHRALAAPADKRAAAIALAYEPYQKLLDDPALGAQADTLKDYVYRRWDDSVPTGGDVAALPGMVVAAIAEISRSRGQAMLDNAAAAQASDPAKAAGLHTDGLAKLKHAIELNTGLLKRQDLTPGVRAQAMFNLAVGIYYIDPSQQSNQIQCATILTDLGDQLPDQKPSEPGIVNAVSLLHYLRQQPSGRATAGAPYARAADVLITKYPGTKAALDERLYFANEVLVPEGKFARAVDVLRPIPPDHPDYFPAQRLLLDCLQQEYRATRAAAAAATQPIPAVDPAALAAQVKSEAARIYEEAGKAQKQATGQEAAIIRYTAGWARLTEADMAMDADQDPAKALGILQSFNRDYAGDNELIRLMFEKRIVALFKSDKLDDAVKESERMMDAFPDDAAPVVDRVLSGLDQHMEDLRYKAAKTLVDSEKAALLGRVDAIARQELKLAEYLMNWATKQKFSDDRLVPFELIYAKSLRLSGEPRKAVTILEPLVAKNADSADLLSGLAESYFAAGAPKADKPTLDKAGALYDKLISGLPADNGKYPLMWWTAWMRRLQISDLTKTDTGQINMLVRQLRNTDPNLGGETTRNTFESLANKYAQ